jgi:hypothetical protein
MTLPPTTEPTTETDESTSDVFYHRRIIVQDGLIQTSMLSSPESPSIVRAWIPESILIITSRCFENCKTFQSFSFEFSSGLTQIEPQAFCGFSLTSIVIPSSVEILRSSCFQRCKSLSTLLFQSNSQLIRIESSALSGSTLQSIMIPMRVQILESACFASCESLSSISFEPNSQLTRIEARAFFKCALESFMIPSSVEFIDASAFSEVDLFECFVECGNRRFVMKNDLLIDVCDHKLIHNFSRMYCIEIPWDVEILGPSCFATCPLVSSISYESNSRLRQIESRAFAYCSFESMVIPSNVQFIDISAFECTLLSDCLIESGNQRFIFKNSFLIDVLDHKLIHSFPESSNVEIPCDIEILGSLCFGRCDLISSISFESNLRLIRIEHEAFIHSSLQSIIIPNSVEVIEADCFADCRSLESVFIESNSRLTRIGAAAFASSSLQSIIIPNSVEIVEFRCFANCRSITSISIESNSRLTQIEAEAFSNSSIRSFVIPSNVQIIGSFCFAYCTTLLSLSFEAPSQLKRIKFGAFAGCTTYITIPSTILSVTYNAHPYPFQLSISDKHSCPEFSRWRRLRERGVKIDFHRIQRFGPEPDLGGLKTSLFNISEFEAISVIGRSDRVLSEIYRHRNDGTLVVMKTISLSSFIHHCQVHTEIENLFNLRHPMIAPLIGHMFSVEPNGEQELKIIRSYGVNGCLADVLSTPPEWWTATMKAKAIVGIALGLRFVHSLGLLHGSLKASNILFNADMRIQIVDFSPMRLETGEVEPFSGEEWDPKVDVSAFAFLLFEIVFGCHSTSFDDVMENLPLNHGVPNSVLEIIEEGRSPKSNRDLSSFIDIIRNLKGDHFEIMTGVDSDEVSAFVDEVESFEVTGE